MSKRTIGNLHRILLAGAFLLAAASSLRSERSYAIDPAFTSYAAVYRDLENRLARMRKARPELTKMQALIYVLDQHRVEIVAHMTKDFPQRRQDVANARADFVRDEVMPTLMHNEKLQHTH